MNNRLAAPGITVGHVTNSGYRPTGLHTYVYNELRNALLDGRFAPGEVLSLRMLAQALGTSPMPVRDAIRRLTTEGVLEVHSNRSFAVISMTRKQFEDLTELRLQLEGTAAEEAVRNQNGELEKELADIEAQARLERDGGSKEAFSQRLSLNRKFHFTLYRYCENKLRIRLIELLWLQSASFTHLSLSQFNPYQPGKHHRDIIAAVKANNPEAAKRALENDIRETYEHILTVFKFPR